MKHGIKPTAVQKKVIATYKHKSEYLHPANWLVVKNLPDVLVLRQAYQEHNACTEGRCKGC